MQETKEGKSKGKSYIQKASLLLIIVVAVPLGLYLLGRYTPLGFGRLGLETFLSKIVGGNFATLPGGEKANPNSEDKNFSISAGETLPEGFPSDFPLYPEAKIVSSFTANGGGTSGVSVVWESQDSLEKIIAFYKAELPKGEWKIVSSFDREGSSTISFEKDNISGFLGIAKGEKELSIISVTIGKKGS
ncbi:MAG: hypothetical protein AAB875_05645 [Patescibacteria group bacterium]